MISVMLSAPQFANRNAASNLAESLQLVRGYAAQDMVPILFVRIGVRRGDECEFTLLRRCSPCPLSRLKLSQRA